MHLEEVQRLGQAAESPGAEAAQADSVRERRVDRLAHGRGDHDLAAVRCEADPRGSVRRTSELTGRLSLCSPILSRTSVPPGQAWARIARWIASAAPSAAGGCSNTAK